MACCHAEFALSLAAVAETIVCSQCACPRGIPRLSWPIAADYMIPQTFTVTSEHIRFRLLFSFSVLHFLVVVSVRLIKLTHVDFRAHVKIASRIVSYRIVNTETEPPALQKSHPAQ